MKWVKEVVKRYSGIESESVYIIRLRSDGEVVYINAGGYSEAEVAGYWKRMENENIPHSKGQGPLGSGGFMALYCSSGEAKTV